MTTDNIVNGIIRNVSVSNADHGILTLWLTIEHQYGTQGFGGYVLYNPNFPDKDCGGWWLWRCFETVDVTDLKSLEQKVIRVDQDSSSIHGIGHPIKNKWFYPRTELEAKINQQ